MGTQTFHQSTENVLHISGYHSLYCQYWAPISPPTHALTQTSIKYEWTSVCVGLRPYDLGGLSPSSVHIHSRGPFPLLWALHRSMLRCLLLTRTWWWFVSLSVKLIITFMCLGLYSHQEGKSLEGSIFFRSLGSVLGSHGNSKHHIVLVM